MFKIIRYHPFSNTKKWVGSEFTIITKDKYVYLSIPFFPLIPHPLFSPKCIFHGLAQPDPLYFYLSQFLTGPVSPDLLVDLLPQNQASSQVQSNVHTLITPYPNSRYTQFQFTITFLPFDIGVLPRIQKQAVSCMYFLSSFKSFFLLQASP